MTYEAEQKVRIALERLWWMEYDTLGNDGVFDLIEDTLREIGAPLPNDKYGGRAPRWAKKKKETKCAG